jgi:hypothetical protein
MMIGSFKSKVSLQFGLLTWVLARMNDNHRNICLDSKVGLIHESVECGNMLFFTYCRYRVKNSKYRMYMTSFRPMVVSLDNNTIYMDPLTSIFHK